MAPEEFDRWLRVLARSGSRRVLISALVASVAAPAVTDARKNNRDKKRRKEQKSGKRGGKGCKNRYSEGEILSLIGKAAKKYGQSKSVMVRVARCESNLDPCAVNNSGPYYGLFQYLKSTWKSTPYGNESIWDPRAQAMATGWMWKQGRKNEWACK